MVNNDIVENNDVIDDVDVKKTKTSKKSKSSEESISSKIDKIVELVKAKGKVDYGELAEQ